MGNPFSRNLSERLRDRGFEFENGKHKFISDLNTYTAKEIPNIWKFRVFIKKHHSHSWLEYKLDSYISAVTKGGSVKRFYFAYRNGEIWARMKNCPDEVKLRLGETVKLNDHLVRLEYTFSRFKPKKVV